MGAGIEIIFDLGDMGIDISRDRIAFGDMGI